LTRITCAGDYTRDQVLQMENVMLNTLKFDLVAYTPIHYLCTYLRVATCVELAHLKRISSSSSR
jgi:hypothetical protein